MLDFRGTLRIHHSRHGDNDDDDDDNGRMGGFAVGCCLRRRLIYVGRSYFGIKVHTLGPWELRWGWGFGYMAGQNN